MYFYLILNLNPQQNHQQLELLKHYADVFGKGEKYHYYIFSKGGFTEGLQELADKGEVRLVTLQDMYK